MLIFKTIMCAGGAYLFARCVGLFDLSASIAYAVFMGVIAFSCQYRPDEGKPVQRKVVMPTVEHCRSIVAGDDIAIPVYQFYNWFLIKYGYGDDLVTEENRGRGVGMRLIKYYFWCKRFLKENDHVR